MRKVLSIGFLLSAIPVFASGSASAGAPELHFHWVQPMMLLAMLLLAVTSRQISRVR